MKNIEEIVATKEGWKNEFKNITKYFEQNIGKPNCFIKKVKVYFPTEEKSATMLISDYYVNLMMLRPCYKLNHVPTTDMLFNCDQIRTSDISNYINKHYVRPYRGKVSSKVLNQICVKIIEDTKSVLEKFGDIVVTSYNLHEVGKLAEQNDEFNDIIHTELDENMQAYDVEKYAKGKLNRAIDILIKSNCGIGTLLKAGVFNPAQLQEFLVVIGNKPNIFGHTIPKPIDTNILVGGLNTPSNMYIDAKAGRKATIMNKIFTGDSGYFSRKLNLLAFNLSLNDDPHYDCGSPNLIPMLIEDESKLSAVEGKYYKFNDDENEELKCVKYTDEHLIGQTIYIRSAMTCASKNGVCRYCYGEMYHIMKDIHCGEFATTDMSSKFTQDILSSKHSLMTKSDKIILNKESEKYIALNKNAIIVRPSEKVAKYYIKIQEENLLFTEVEDKEYNSLKEMVQATDLNLNSFEIVNDEGKVVCDVYEESGASLIPTETMFDLMSRYTKKDKCLIPVSAIFNEILEDDDTDGQLFSININNNEKTKTLNLVKKLLERNKNDDMTYYEFENKFIKLLKDGNIKQMIVHSEMILRNLIRKAGKLTKYPNYSKKLELGDYEILTLQRALAHHPSPIVSVSYERVDEQLNKINLYNKHEPSLLDVLFMTNPFNNDGYYQEEKTNDDEDAIYYNGGHLDI